MGCGEFWECLWWVGICLSLLLYVTWSNFSFGFCVYLRSDVVASDGFCTSNKTGVASCEPVSLN